MTDEIGSIACHFCKGKGRLRERDIHGEYNWEICGCVMIMTTAIIMTLLMSL